MSSSFSNTSRKILPILSIQHLLWTVCGDIGGRGGRCDTGMWCWATEPVLPGLQRLNMFVIKNWSRHIPVNWLIHTNSRAVRSDFKCLFRLVLPPTLQPPGIFPSSVLSALCLPFCWIMDCVHKLTDSCFLSLEWCHGVVGSSPVFFSFILIRWFSPWRTRQQCRMYFNCQPATCIRKSKFLLHACFLKFSAQHLFIWARAAALGFCLLPEVAGIVPKGALQNTGGAAHVSVVLTVRQRLFGLIGKKKKKQHRD